MCFISICLPGLGEQNEWSSICRLQTKCEIKQNKRILIKFIRITYIKVNPEYDYNSLCNQKEWGSKESGKTLCSFCEPVATKYC